MKNIKNLFTTLFCTTVLLTQPSCLRDSYSVKLSGPVTLGETWAEFNPETSLKPDKDWQEVGLELEQPFNLDFFAEGNGPDKGKGILMPDKDVINPEIEVIGFDPKPPPKVLLIQKCLNLIQKSRPF